MWCAGRGGCGRNGRDGRGGLADWRGRGEADGCGDVLRVCEQFRARGGARGGRGLGEEGELEEEAALLPLLGGLVRAGDAPAEVRAAAGACAFLDGVRAGVHQQDGGRGEGGVEGGREERGFALVSAEAGLCAGSVLALEIEGGGRGTHPGDDGRVGGDGGAAGETDVGDGRTAAADALAASAGGVHGAEVGRAVVAGPGHGGGLRDGGEHGYGHAGVARVVGRES